MELSYSLLTVRWYHAVKLWGKAREVVGLREASFHSKPQPPTPQLHHQHPACHHRLVAEFGPARGKASVGVSPEVAPGRVN